MNKKNFFLPFLAIIIFFLGIKSPYCIGEEKDISDKTADYYFQLSQIHSTNNNPQEALLAIEKAVILSPTNIEYLRARAKIANWNKKYDIAIDSYQRILTLLPNDRESLLGLAKTLSWSGKLDKSIIVFKKYLSPYPEDPEALIEYAKTEIWCGNYSVAMETINRYYEIFGETKEYIEVKARILSLSNRPNSALRITTPIFEKDPNNYNITYSHTIALKYANRLKESIECLGILEKLNPDSSETESIIKFIKTPLRPNISFNTNFYSDSDNLNIIDFQIKGEYPLSPETFLKAGKDFVFLNARQGSGLENIDGSENSNYSQIWLGVKHQFSPFIALDINTGIASVDNLSNSKFVYSIFLETRPCDELKIGLLHSHDFFVVSPRTVSLGIEKKENRISFQWEPNFLYTYIIDIKHTLLSDSNKYWEVLFAPRRSLIRKERYNMDIGISAWILSFDKDFNNGYYSPSFYQRYYLTNFIYWKISDDDGIGLVISAGIQKDENMGSFKFGNSVDIEGTFGLYRDWMLKMRGSILNNTRQITGSFNAFKFSIELMKRF